MTSLSALCVATAISLLISSCICWVMLRPLNSLLQTSCPTPAAVGFWSRFTILMLFLGPLFLATAFGLPTAELASKMDAGDLIERIIVAALVGAFLAMLGMGLWVSALLRRAPETPVAPAVRNADRYGA